MKYLVTGAAGFIGSSISARLIADQNNHVVGIDALTDYYDPALKELNLQRLSAPNFEFLRADINACDLVSTFEGVDVVIHQAGQPGVRRSWGTEFQTYIDDNILATQRLLEAAKSLGTIKRFVYASSSSVYGDAEAFPTDETVRPRPLSPYGVTKLAAEHLVGLYGLNFGLSTVALRYFTVFGPRQRPDMAFTRFLRAAELGTTISIFGSGQQIRDFTYIDDVVEANILAAQSPDIPTGTVLNVAGGSNISVNGVLDIVKSLASQPLKVEYTRKVAGDVFRTAGSIVRIKESLGWAPRVTVAEGLERQIEWVRTTL